MKKVIIITLLIVAALLYVHHKDARLAVTTSTPHAVLVQNTLKNSSAPALSNAQSEGKIPLLGANDQLFHHELMALNREFTGFLGLYQRKSGVTLTAKQQDNIARALAMARLSQMLYEAEIAKVDDSNPAVVKVSIPAYDGDSLRDFLVNKITEDTNDPALARSIADDMGRNFDHYGTYSQNLEMTQRPDAINGHPVTAVMITNKTMAAPGIPVASNSSYLKDDLHEFTPFGVFLK